MAQKFRVIILQNENPDDTRRWVEACRKKANLIEFIIVDIVSEKWLENIRLFHPDIILTKPPGTTNFFKNLYDERLTILAKELEYFCFPSLDEVMIYENKKYLSYFLAAHNLPFPQTFVFFKEKEASNFLDNCTFPIIAKLNIGASGRGIKFIANVREGKLYLNKAFSNRGVSRKYGPNLKKGGLIKRGLQYFIHPSKIKARLGIYKSQNCELQNKFVLFQEYIDHEFEWRVVRLGDSFFAHKKIKEGDMASGTLIKEYGAPPMKLLDFVKELTDRFSFYSVAVDIFENNDRYLINEVQCIFGQSDPHQMIIENMPGRYIYDDNVWKFEEGDFNSNESYDLRLQAAIQLYEKNIKI